MNELSPTKFHPGNPYSLNFPTEPVYPAIAHQVEGSVSGPVDLYIQGAERPSVEAAEQLPAHDIQALREFRNRELNPTHRAADAEEAATVDPDFRERSEGEQALVETVVDAGDFVLSMDNVHPPSKIRRRRSGLSDAIAELETARQMDEYDRGGDSVEIVFTNIDDLSRVKAEKAIETSDFIRTPELEKAFTEYSADHAKLEHVLKAVAGGTLSPKDTALLKTGIAGTTNHKINAAVTRLLSYDTSTRAGRMRQLEDAAFITCSNLYNERSVPAMSNGQAEADAIRVTGSSLHEAAENEGLIWTHASGQQFWKVAAGQVKAPTQLDRPLPIREFEAAATRAVNLKEQVQEDMRYAGQLLYHNTPHLNEAATQGGAFRLMSRTAQYREKGEWNAASNPDSIPGALLHSNLIHWSELYMPGSNNYKQPWELNDKERTRPGTIALPLAEIVDTTPFSARDIQYGRVTLKPDKIDCQTVVVNNGVIFGPNEGAFDVPGREGRDRVFLPGNKADEQDSAHDVTYHFGKSPHGKVLLTKSDMDWHGVSQYPFGSGEGYPETVHIHFKDSRKVFHNKSYGSPEYAAAELEYHDSEKAVTDAIAFLQAQSIEQYGKEQLVVPLREGVMEFSVEGMPPDIAAKNGKIANSANFSPGR